MKKNDLVKRAVTSVIHYKYTEDELKDDIAYFRESVNLTIDTE